MKFQFPNGGSFFCAIFFRTSRLRSFGLFLIVCFGRLKCESFFYNLIIINIIQSKNICNIQRLNITKLLGHPTITSPPPYHLRLCYQK
jgi:hypothetical protein